MNVPGTHAATLSIDAQAVTIHHSPLARALGAPAREVIPLDSVTDVTPSPASDAAFGSVTFHTVDGDYCVRFVPGSNPQQAVDLFLSAQKGELAGSVPGLNFCALDVETANDHWGSICQVGVVRFRDGQPVEEVSWLCQPPAQINHFEDVNVSIHGIRPEDVADSPSVAEVLPQVGDFIGSDVMVAHNAIFDSTALQHAAQATGTAAPQLSIACSLALARNATAAGVLKVANHKLPTVATAVGAGSFKHHDAAADARAAGLIVAGLASAFGYTGSITDLYSSRDFTLGSVTTEQVMPMLRKKTAPKSPADLGAGTDFRDPAGPQARRQPAPWAAVATPDTVPDANPDANPDGPLFGQHVTLTGDFEPYSKGALWDAIADRGGIVGKSVTKKTTILVLGTWATQTSKEKRARQLIEQGQDIQLWPEERLIQELDLKPPF